MKLLILGGNGFIGFEVARTATARGHTLTCIGRNIEAAKTKLPTANWLRVDISELSSAEDWARHLEGIDAIINCSGALQSSPRDNLEATQFTSLRALYDAAVKHENLPVIQISANTMAGRTAGTTEFLETKSRADEELKQSDLPHVILRPAFVVGRNCYGGSALLRAAASLPWEMSTGFDSQPCHTTDLEALANIIVDAAEGKHGASGDFAVASKEITTIGEINAQIRAWLGLDASFKFAVPEPVMTLTARAADIAGYFGWRSPLRTTALKILREGIVADGRLEILDTISLAETLAKHPSGAQDIWFGRAYFLKPAIILTLSAFWFLTGIITLFQIEAGLAYFTPLGLGHLANLAIVIGTSLLDCVLGVAVLFRKWAKSAALGMIAVSLCYLASATLILPSLWFDPIGPLVKVIPSIILTVVLLAVLEER